MNDIIHTRPDINRYQRMLIHRIRITIQSLIYEIYFKYISNSNTQLLSLSILPIGSSYQSNQLHCIVSIILYFYTLYAILYSITFTGMWQLVSLPANLATSPLLPHHHNYITIPILYSFCNRYSKIKRLKWSYMYIFMYV